MEKDNEVNGEFGYIELDENSFSNFFIWAVTEIGKWEIVNLDSEDKPHRIFYRNVVDGKAEI